MRRLLRNWPVIGAALAAPVSILFLVQGLVSLYTSGVEIAAVVAGCITLLTCVGAAVWLRVSSRRQAGESAHNIVDMVTANPSWGSLQKTVWDDLYEHIDALLTADERFEVILDHSLSVLREVAMRWNESDAHVEFSVTLPEALLATETLAVRYRKVLIANIPFVNRIKLSKALSLWKLYEKHESTLKYGYGAYRTYRVFSIPGIISELGSLLYGQLSEQATQNLAYNLKRAYLQEVANVAIDLYSGNFRRAINELPFEQDIVQDLDRLAEKAGPIRISIVGQVSSGKSTLTNALLEALEAESGLVPTTEKFNVYQFRLAEAMDTHIVDTPGLEADAKSSEAALAGLVEADLVIWVMRANQPGRQVDQQLYSAFKEYFANSPERQTPPVLVAATHIDCIPAFAKVSEDDIEAVTVPLAQACGKVIEYEAFCPLVLDGVPIGLDSLRTNLATLYERAVNARLNRIRVNQPSLYQDAFEEFSALSSGSIEALKMALKKR